MVDEQSDAEPSMLEQRVLELEAIPDLKLRLQRLSEMLTWADDPPAQGQLSFNVLLCQRLREKGLFG